MYSDHTRRPRRSGTTLLELAVALTITAALGAIGAAAFRQVIAQRDLVREATVSTERAAAVRALLRGWVQSGDVEPPSMTRSINGMTIMHRREPVLDARTRALAVTPARPTGDELYLSTWAAELPTHSYARIRLFVDDDPDTPERGLTMEYRSSSEDPWFRRQLDPAIIAMTVEYLDEQRARWTSATAARNTRPVAVRIMFTHASDDTRLWRLPLTFPVGPDVLQRRRS